MSDMGDDGGLSVSNEPTAEEIDKRYAFNPFPEPEPASWVVPEEPGPGSVIGFVKDYGNGKLYHFAGVHVAGRDWYLTGPDYMQPRSWTDLLDFVGEENWSSIGVVTGWDRLAEFRS